MSQRTAAGSKRGVWTVIVIVAFGVIVALLGLKFRQVSEEGDRTPTTSTRASTVGGEQGH